MVVRSCISVENLRFSVYTKRTKPPPLEHKMSHDIPLAFWLNPGGGFHSFTLFLYVLIVGNVPFWFID